MRIHLGSINIDPNAEPDPAVTEVRIGLSRPGGWLVGGPSQDHRAACHAHRWHAPPNCGCVPLSMSRNPRIDHHPRGSALGVTRRTWTVDETVIGPARGDSFSFGPEARVLLGEIMQAAGPVPDGTAAGRLARLLAAVGVADPPGQSGITVRTEPLERFLADRLRALRARSAMIPTSFATPSTRSAQAVRCDSRRCLPRTRACA